jgi:hypothetical protein
VTSGFEMELARMQVENAELKRRIVELSA